MADRWRTSWPDGALALFLGFLAVMGTGPAAANQGLDAPPAAYALAVTAALPIAIWRWRPMWTFASVGAATILYLGLGYAYGPILITLALAVYGLTARYPVRSSLTGVGVLLLGSAAAIGAGVLAGYRDWPEFLTVTAWLVIPTAVGLVLKVRRDAAADVRSAQARRAISEERLRLAQEVHDVVGHGLAVIAMQSGVALRVFHQNPAAAWAALDVIRRTSQEGLDGLRAELGALRQETGWREAPRRPATGLADLPALAERMRASGLPVSLQVPDVRDGPPAVPAEVEHAAYRIVQESLTNALRHAGPGTQAQVRLTRVAHELHVEVLDTGRGGPPPTSGHGIEGMRERAAALGGVVEAGPCPSGGFRVSARLPCARPAPVAGDPP
jgi:signal transduction histidine kinase